MTIYDRVFGKRYRQVIRNWEETLQVSGTNETRYVTITILVVRVEIHVSPHSI